jgi:hypothetical protein
MSLQKELDRIETEIDKIRLDPKYLQLKNKKRSQFDTNRYTKYTRQLSRLNVQKRAVIKKMKDAGIKPQKREVEPGTFVQSKPAWRNQANKVAHKNQDEGKISRNWVRERKEAKEVAPDFPAKRNAVDSAKPDPDPVTINYKKTTKTPARLFVKKMLYHKPVVRNASQMAKLKEEGEARIKRRMHPVNETVRTRPQQKTTGPTEPTKPSVKPASRRKQARKSRTPARPEPEPEEEEIVTPESSSKSDEQESNEGDWDSLEAGSDDNIEDSEELIDDLSN